MATLDLRASQLDIFFPRGDSLDEPIEFVDADDNPISIWADATFAAQVRRGANDPVAIDLTIDPSEWVSDRRIRVQLAKEITETLGGNYAWDLEVRLDGKTRTRLGGLFSEDLDVTKTA